MQYFRAKTKILGGTLRRYSTSALHPNSPWKSVIGLEIHAQIQSVSKLFSGAKVSFGSPVNSCVSPFDASIPGTLPVLNEQCVEAGVKTALALSCDINEVSMFDRKHYFYADLPNGYQITQQRAPLANRGQLSFHVFVPGVTKKPYHKTARLHQLQLEQDSGKSLHDAQERKSLVDLNRAGVPLMELVFEPDLSTGEEAAALVKELMLILTRLGTCSCKMEEGALRVDANISIHKEHEPLGIRTEVKNIGSVRGVADAITFEIARQIELVENGGIVHNETRMWDALDKRTIPMRDKEVQQDYRFMPEPNLPPLHLNVGQLPISGMINVEEIRKFLPELPEDTRQKLIENYKLSEDVAAVLLNEERLLEYFYEIKENNPECSPKMISNVLINDLLTLCHRNKTQIGDCQINSTSMAELIEMLHTEVVNLNLARLILNEMFLHPTQTPKMIADRHDWYQISDPERIQQLCSATIADNPKVVAQYKKGKTKLLYGLAGMIAKNTDQKANMAMVVHELTEMLKK